MIPLKYKPDMQDTMQRFDAFWNGELLGRSCVAITAPKQAKDNRKYVPYRSGADGAFLDALSAYDAWAEQTYFAGESLPSFNISLGPDQFAAFLGAKMTEPPAGETNWVEPCIENPEEASLELHSDNQAWMRILDFYRVAAEYSKGRFLLDMLDLHSNLDCLSAMRGPQNLCVDLLIHPDAIERLVNQANALYPIIYNAVYEAGDMRARGTTGWAPAYCKGKFAVIECDALCMISVEDSRRFVMPGLSMEAAFLDHCVFHLDGEGALRHLDDILAIREINAIQWVPGHGRPITVEWMDVLHKIQAAGKAVWIYDCTPEQIKQHHRQLNPARVLYSLEAPTMQEADDLIAWLEKNS